MQCGLVAKLCLTLCDPIDLSLPGSSVHGIYFLVKDTGVGNHFLLQEGLPDPGIEPGSSALQADSLLIESPGKPQVSWTRAYMLTLNLPAV